MARTAIGGVCYLIYDKCDAICGMDMNTRCKMLYVIGEMWHVIGYVP